MSLEPPTAHGRSLYNEFSLQYENDSALTTMRSSGCTSQNVNLIFITTTPSLQVRGSSQC
ncbi:hypothetical protein QTP88_010971 [Uroleucon formosanum]